MQVCNMYGTGNDKDSGFQLRSKKEMQNRKTKNLNDSCKMRSSVAKRNKRHLYDRFLIAPHSQK